MNKEQLAYKIRCQWCKREIWIPGPLQQVPNKDIFYCANCGCYTRIPPLKGKKTHAQHTD